MSYMALFVSREEHNYCSSALKRARTLNWFITRTVFPFWILQRASSLPVPSGPVESNLLLPTQLLHQLLSLPSISSAAPCPHPRQYQLRQPPALLSAPMHILTRFTLGAPSYSFFSSLFHSVAHRG
jgi:hypothetical protein